jgi:Ser/Thr protein kinase RdoA (MazF antagonist)
VKSLLICLAVIDFGDLVHAPIIGDIAISLAHIVGGSVHMSNDMLADICHYLKGMNSLLNIQFVTELILRILQQWNLAR